MLAPAQDEGGARYYARRYAEFLARHGVTLELRPRSGSVASAALVADATSGVDVAFVQSGTVVGEQATHVGSLGSLCTCRCGVLPGRAGWTT